MAASGVEYGVRVTVEVLAENGQPVEQGAHGVKDFLVTRATQNAALGTVERALDEKLKANGWSHA